MIESLLDQLLPVVQEHGYWMVGAVLLIENMGIPVPGELILISAGMLAFEGHLNALEVALWAIVGAILGDNIGFVLGRWWGPRLLQLYARTFRVAEDKIARVQLFFLRYSGWAVFLGRFIALLRMFAGPLAGILGMRWAHFLLCNTAGAVVWVATILGGSFLFGANMRTIISAVGIWGILALGGLLLYVKLRVARSLFK